MRFHRRPDAVDAIHYIGVNEEQVMEFVGRGKLAHYGNGTQLMIPIGGNTGVMIVSVGDWVIKHPDGTVSTASDATFTATYEPSEAY
jgi:hypothetical protein